MGEAPRPVFPYHVHMNLSVSETFRAELAPHNALTPRGFQVLMWLVAGICGICGVVFYLIGAWPVVGFLGLDVLIIYWAFRASFRNNERREIIEVSDHRVTVTRVAPRRQDEVLQFLRSLVRIELEEDRQRELIGRLLIRERGRICEIGSFLGPDERRSFFKAFKAAVYGFAR